VTAAPEPVVTYGRDVASHLGDVLGSSLLATGYVGSMALGGFDPHHSDVDIVAVVEGPVADHHIATIVASVGHPALPCPVRGLELVIYDRSTTRVATPGAAFELNLNTGPDMAPRCEVHGRSDEEFWFVLDREVAARRAVTITGADVRDLVAPMPSRWVLAALRESLRWQGDHGSMEARVLRACRAWRYTMTGEIVSKDDAASWAIGHGLDRAVVTAALEQRHGRPTATGLDPGRVADLVAFVDDRLHDPGDP
jgi:Aminoglycoside adenylyltransferase, C-terminal domain